MCIEMTELEGKKEETDAAKKIIHTYPLIRHSDMMEEMKGEVMELVVTACEKHSTNNEMAARMIKETMDKKFGPSWHTVVGEGFGFEISYEYGNAILIYACGTSDDQYEWFVRILCWVVT